MINSVLNNARTEFKTYNKVPVRLETEGEKVGTLDEGETDGDVEGENVGYTDRDAEGKDERIGAIEGEMLGNRVGPLVNTDSTRIVVVSARYMLLYPSTHM